MTSFHRSQYGKGEKRKSNFIAEKPDNHYLRHVMKVNNNSDVDSMYS